MEVHRYPVLLWRDRSSHFTAALIDPEGLGAAGYGTSAKEATAQLKDYLKWVYRQEPWRDGPRFTQVKMATYKVSVRPEYQVGNKVFPYDRNINLRVACVDCVQSGGLRSAYVPQLGLGFYYNQGRLSDLVRYYVRQKLSHLPPRQVARYLPPEEVFLEHLTFKQQHTFKETGDADLPQLEKVAEAVGARAFRSRFHPAYGREKEVAELAARLGEGGGNVLLVGERGCGKTALLVEVVRKLERRRSEDTGARRRFWMTRGARIIAGLPYLGQWEARCQEVIAELAGIKGTLCAENLLELIRCGGCSAADGVGAFLAPYLERGELSLVAEATPAELDLCRRHLPGLVDLLNIMRLPELESPLDVLGQVATSLRQKYKRTPASEVVAEVYRLHRRFLPYRSFPGPAANFLGQLFTGQAPLDREEVLRRFSQQTGLPDRLLRDEEPFPPEQVEQFFSSRVVGQPRACQAVTRLVTTFKAGLNDPGKPLGVLLFCGPTGVGKTQMAKSLAECFFGAGEDADRLLRLDMSEYSGPWAPQRLLGDEQRVGELVRRIREQPFTVVLLDEIEKAHPDVFDLLLGLFDEGRLTDAWGRTSDFRSAVIIMTSNLGADALRPIGLSQRSQPSYQAEAINFFRPEFYNRIDAVVSFDPLKPEDIETIAGLELKQVGRREGLTERGLRLEWSPAVEQHLARLGYDARYGARPLKRTIEQLVVVPLSRHLVENPELRQTTVGLELDGERLVII